MPIRLKIGGAIETNSIYTHIEKQGSKVDGNFLGSFDHQTDVAWQAIDYWQQRLTHDSLPGNRLQRQVVDNHKEIVIAVGTGFATRLGTEQDNSF